MIKWYDAQRSEELRLTFELDLQHLVGVLNNVSIRPEGMAGAVHTDLQAKVGLWGETREGGR